MSTKQNIYFKRRNGEYILLLENCTEEEAWDAMKKFLDDHNFKHYYTRVWTVPDGNKWFDVGSYSEFFVYGFIDM